MENKKVSIIMNCLNGSEYLFGALESALKQTYQNLEIIIWDNGSIEDISSICNKVNDARVKYFRNEHTEKLGRARNKAIKESSGDFIAFLDCDDLWMPEKIETQLKIFDKDTSVGLVFSDAYFFDKNGLGKQVYKRKKPPIGYVFKQLLSNYFLVMSTVIIKREVFDQMEEHFDCSFEIIEEYELFLRISKRWKLDYANKILAKWRMHDQSTTFKKSHLIPNEKINMLEKFIKIFPNFEIDYTKQIDIVRQKISLTKALNFYIQGEKVLARSEIRGLIFKNKKAFVYYYGTFFSKGTFFKVYRFFTGTMPV